MNLKLLLARGASSELDPKVVENAALLAVDQRLVPGEDLSRNVLTECRRLGAPARWPAAESSKRAMEAATGSTSRPITAAPQREASTIGCASSRKRV